MNFKRWYMSLVVLVVPVMTGCGAQSVSPTPGHQAPPFTLQTLAGETVGLSQLLNKHDAIVLNAWASWCPPCNQETPDLVRLSEQYKDRVQVVGVNMTSSDGIQDAKAFVRRYHIQYPVLMDPNGKFLSDYVVRYYPTTFLLSPSGRVVRVQTGMLTANGMKQLFEQAARMQSQA